MGLSWMGAFGNTECLKHGAGIWKHTVWHPCLILPQGAGLAEQGWPGNDDSPCFPHLYSSVMHAKHKCLARAMTIADGYWTASDGGGWLVAQVKSSMK